MSFTFAWGESQDSEESDQSSRLLYSSAFGEVEFGCPKAAGTQNVQNELIFFFSKLNFPFLRLSNIMATQTPNYNHSGGVGAWRDLREL